MSIIIESFYRILHVQCSESKIGSFVTRISRALNVIRGWLGCQTTQNCPLYKFQKKNFKKNFLSGFFFQISKKNFFQNIKKIRKKSISAPQKSKKKSKKKSIFQFYIHSTQKNVLSPNITVSRSYLVAGPWKIGFTTDTYPQKFKNWEFPKKLKNEQKWAEMSLKCPKMSLNVSKCPKCPKSFSFSFSFSFFSIILFLRFFFHLLLVFSPTLFSTPISTQFFTQKLGNFSNVRKKFFFGNFWNFFFETCRAGNSASFDTLTTPV